MNEIQGNGHGIEHLTDDKIKHESQSSGFEELDEVLEDMPEEERRMVTKMARTSLQMGIAISPGTELMKKVTPDNINTFFETTKLSREYDYREGRDSKIFYGIITLIILSFVLVLVVVLKDKPDILEKVLYAAGGLATGLIGGYGLGKSKKGE